MWGGYPYPYNNRLCRVPVRVRRTIPAEAESEAHPGFDERLFVLSKKPTSVSNALDRAVERSDGVQVHSSFTLAAMRSCCHNATRAPARTFVFAALVALSLLGWGKLAATNVFDTLTQSVPVEDCAKVRKSGDETTAQRSATGDFCAFARERKSRVVVVQFVRGGQFGESAVRELFDSMISPNGTSTASSTTIEPYDARKHAEPDLIVEGPPKFSKLSSCAIHGAHIPWLQFSAEPGRYYEEDDWCSHGAAPIARLDTSFHHICRVDQSKTVFIWTPYAKVSMSELLFDSSKTFFDWKQWRERPNFLAWVASNCKVKRRQTAFRSIHKYASTHEFGEVHALGNCARNKVSDDVKPRSAGWSSVADVYKNYRFVLAMESQLEHGYVTEKIVTAFSAGAIPVYYGDSDAAAFLFSKLNVPYIDVRYVWKQFARRPVNYERPKSANWFMIAQYMHDFEKSPRTYIEAQHANVAQKTSQNVYEAYSLAEMTLRCN